MDGGNTSMIVLGVIVLLVVLGVASMIMARQRRTQRLQEQFGPEYDHMIEVTRAEEQAERELEERLEQARSLNIRPLSVEEVNRYALEWQATQRDFVDEPLMAVQSKFVDDPSDSVKQADQLVADVIKDITRSFADRRGSLEKQWNGGEQASTEDLRIALKQYRYFFDRLLTLES